MDSLLLKSKTINGMNSILAVVCDGVGSLEGGGFASGTAVRLLNDWLDTVSTTEHIGLRMRDTILDINKQIITEAHKQGIETASTISALLLLEDSYFSVHAGDSRIYTIENKSLCLLTSDDVSQDGKLTACIGRTENLFLQYTEGLARGKTFLLCSDGLYKRMDETFMTTELQAWSKRTLDEPLKTLPRHVIERGEKDNISLSLVKIEA